MSTKIYDTFIVKAKNPTSFPTLMGIAQSARCRILDTFRDNFGKAVLIRLFKIVDLVAFYGDDILEIDKFKQLDDNHKELIQKWIKIKNTHPDSSDSERHLMLWYAAVNSMTTSLKELEKEYHQSNHKAKMMFIPCGRKTLGMFFGDCSYNKILFEDTENIADYHYQDQTDKPDDISDAEWKRRAKDWDKAIGPDYIPLNHGMEFTLLNYDNVEEEMTGGIKAGLMIDGYEDYMHINDTEDCLECVKYADTLIKANCSTPVLKWYVGKKKSKDGDNDKIIELGTRYRKEWFEEVAGEIKELARLHSIEVPMVTVQKSQIRWFLWKNSDEYLPK